MYDLEALKSNLNDLIKQGNINYHQLNLIAEIGNNIARIEEHIKELELKTKYWVQE